MNKWFKFVQSQLLPQRCLLCGSDSKLSLICPPCQRSLPLNLNPCACCAQPLPASAPSGNLCADCLAHHPAFSQVIAPYLYAPPLDQMLLRLKSAAHLPTGLALAELLANYLEHSEWHRPQVLLPSPLSDSRLRQRGFNQSAELCLHLSNRLDIPWSSHALCKCRDTPHQSELNRQQRLRNLKGSFALADGQHWQHVAIVDDVVTTGATAQEMAATLIKAGVQRVELLAIARTPPPGYA